MSVPSLTEINNIIQSPRTLTTSLKEKYFGKIIKRDGVFNCFFCNIELCLGEFDYEHLNDDRGDNRIENIVFACRSCNNKKTHDESMKKLALEKLEENESNVLCVRNFEKRDTSVEIDTNTIGFDMAKKYLEKKLKKNEYLDYDDAKYSINYLVGEEVRHSSVVTIDRHLRTLCSSAAPYDFVKDGKQKRIFKKKINKAEKEGMKHVEVHKSMFVDSEEEGQCREYLERAHNVEKCETCVLNKEIQNERRKIEKINSQNSISEQIDDNPFPNVGHCGDQLCFRPAYDGDRWCPKCRDFWSKFWNLSIEMTFDE